MSFGETIVRALRSRGRDIVRFDPVHHYEPRWTSLVKRYGINLVLDVGANTGQYAARIRQWGYAGRIISLEPLREEYLALAAAAESDSRWEARNLALGETDGRRTIHVSENSYSSSLLEVLPRHIESEPGVKSIGAQQIELRKLDSIFNELCSDKDVPYLKIDAQGYEMRILEGAAKSVDRINMLQLEMSLTPLYDGESLLPEVTTWLYERRFVLVSLEPGYVDPHSHEVLQVDGIFRRPAVK